MNSNRLAELYRSISAKRGNGVDIPRSLCFYSPSQVLSALRENREVTSWLKFISNHYVPPKADVLLIYPCSADKPYYKSRSYETLFKTLEKLGERRRDVHVATISEPFGLVPEEFYRKKVGPRDWSRHWYDCPGLFEWFCDKHGIEYSEQDFESSVEILGRNVGAFLKKVRKRKSYNSILAFVRTYSSTLQNKRDHTHHRIIEIASEESGVEVKVRPTRRMVSSLVSERGRLAWDMYGVSHPIIQEDLLRELKSNLRPAS